MINISYLQLSITCISIVACVLLSNSGNLLLIFLSSQLFGAIYKCVKSIKATYILQGRRGFEPNTGLDQLSI